MFLKEVSYVHHQACVYKIKNAEKKQQHCEKLLQF